MEAATHGFLHTDLIDQTYMCYMLPRTKCLQLTRLEKSNTPETQIFGIVTSISAKDAVYLEKLKMIAVLAPCGTLMMYSGPNLIGKVHVGGVLSSLANLPSNSGHSFGNGYPRYLSLAKMDFILFKLNFRLFLDGVAYFHPAKMLNSRKDYTCYHPYILYNPNFQQGLCQCYFIIKKI